MSDKVVPDAVGVSPEVPVKPKRKRLVRDRLQGSIGNIQDYSSDTDSIASTQSTTSAPEVITVAPVPRPVVRINPSRHEINIQALLSPVKQPVIPPIIVPDPVIEEPVIVEPVMPVEPVIDPVIPSTRKYLNEIYKYILVSINTECVG